MKLTIGLIPSIKENYKNQFSYIIDMKWFIFLKRIFNNPQIKILIDDKIPDLDLVIITGGNTIKKFSKKKDDYLRQKKNLNLLKKILKKNIPCIGICYGAQLISYFYSANLKKCKKHVGFHDIMLVDKNNDYLRSKIYKVNSFHNQAIHKLEDPLKTILISEDKNIEMFIHKNKKIVGIMWHPERNIKISKLDKMIFKKILCN